MVAGGLARQLNGARLQDGLTWDRDTLLPKYALPYDVSLIGGPGTIMPEDCEVFLDTIRSHGELNRARHASMLDLLGARWTIGPQQSKSRNDAAVAIAADAVLAPRETALAAPGSCIASTGCRRSPVGAALRSKRAPTRCCFPTARRATGGKWPSWKATSR